MLRHLIILFMLFPFCPDGVYGQILKNMSVAFTRTITKEASEEAVKGFIYYQAPKKIVLKVIEPVKQWMVFEGKTMLIYYPNEHRAFRFTSENPFAVPFFQAFTGAVREDFGLSEAGFTLFRNEMRGDTLFTYWEPPKQAKKFLGNTVTGLAKDRLVFMEVQDAEGKRLVRTTYHKHVKHGEAFFPLEVVSVQHQENGSVVEKIAYANPQFDVALPQEVMNFRIPMDAEVTEIKW